jgi:hypothetical protein
MAIEKLQLSAQQNKRVKRGDCQVNKIYCTRCLSAEFMISCCSDAKSVEAREIIDFLFIYSPAEG